MDFEIRADGVLHIEGYVNAVERDSRIVMCPECGKCVEQIAAGAFGNALRAAKNVDMLLNHDKGRKIGSTSEGTLALTEDSIGLRASADITDEEVVEKARNGLLRGWSFGFRATDTEIEQRSQGVPRRHVKALNISEVSLIDDRYRPCYAGTSIELRADEGAEEADFTELRIDTSAHEKTDTPDYSSYEARLARVRMRELELRAEEAELHFNPYHDPQNGRFTTANGGGSGGFLYSKGGKSAYVFERDIDGEYEQWKKKKSASKALPEHLSEQIGEYTVTDEEIIFQSGKKIPHNGGSYIEKISPAGMKLAKENDIKSPVVFPSRYGNFIVPREVGEKAKSLYETAKANYSANLKNNVPGLDEINKISIAYSNEQYLSRKSIENGYGRLHTPKVTAKDVEAVKKKYPVATKYLTAESFWDSSNDIKSALGKEAMNAIRLGDDPDEAIKRMKSEWEKYVEKSMEYD